LQRWRLITTWGAPPSFNMGLDEALLQGQDSPPTLRFYSWSPDTLSLGYFQRYEDVPGIEKAGAVVRRITGGGAIHHVNELTFSFCTSEQDPLYVGKVADSYCRIHDAIAATLRSKGVEAKIRCDAPSDSDVEGTGMCFHKSCAQDLVWDGRKGVGSAQRRKNGRVLHHGSIKLNTSVLEGDIASLAASGVTLDAGALAPLLLDSFRENLGLSFETSVPTPDERVLAHQLGARYLDPAFVRRR
jgi:lipoate-protein ligase A